jgi:hypothetical protein
MLIGVIVWKSFDTAKLLLPLSGFLCIDKGVGLPYWDSRKSKEHNSLMSSIEGVHDWYRFLLLFPPLIRTRILTHV